MSKVVLKNIHADMSFYFKLFALIPVIVLMEACSFNWLSLFEVNFEEAKERVFLFLFLFQLVPYLGVFFDDIRNSDDNMFVFKNKFVLVSTSVWLLMLGVQVTTGTIVKNDLAGFMALSPLTGYLNMRIVDLLIKSEDTKPFGQLCLVLSVPMFIYLTARLFLTFLKYLAEQSFLILLNLNPKDIVRFNNKYSIKI